VIGNKYIYKVSELIIGEMSNLRYLCTFILHMPFMDFSMDVSVENQTKEGVYG